MAQIKGDAVVSQRLPIELQTQENRESAEAGSGPSGNRGLLAPFTGPTWTVIFLFTAGALSFYDAAVFDNSATAYARLNLPH